MRVERPLINAQEVAFSTSQEVRCEIGWEVVVIAGYRTCGDFEYQDACQEG